MYVYIYIGIDIHKYMIYEVYIYTSRYQYIGNVLLCIVNISIELLDTQLGLSEHRLPMVTPCNPHIHCVVMSWKSGKDWEAKPLGP